MNEIKFKAFLESDINESTGKDKLTSDGINSRISKGKKAEDIRGMDLDEIVSSDTEMRKALEKLQEHENPAHNQMQNAVRKYYKFRNNKECPRKKDL